VPSANNTTELVLSACSIIAFEATSFARLSLSTKIICCNFAKNPNKNQLSTSFLR
jgi:hypothetical protein